MKSFKKSIILTGLLGLMPFTAFAGLEDLAPAKLAQQAKKQIAKQKIGVSASLLNLNDFEGVSLALKYRMSSEPSYVESFYTRVDRYTFDNNISVGDLVDGLNLPIAFSIKKDNQVVFARQFKSQTDSVTAIPYTFLNFPITAERAIEKLQVGDFVSFESNLTLVVGLNRVLPVGSVIKAQAYTHAFVSGNFLVHMFRMPDNKMRLKFIALRGHGKDVGAKIDVDSGLSVVGVSVIDKQIRKIVDITPLALSAKNTTTDLFMLDYVFNLNDATAAKTFTDIMTKRMRFKDAMVANPLVSKAGLSEKMLVDATDVEDLYDADKGKAPGARRVDRVFKGMNTSTSSEGNLKIGLALFSFDKGAAFSEHRVQSYDAQENENRYILDTLDRTTSSKLLFGLYGDKEKVSADLLFTADMNWKPNSFVALTLSREIKMKSVSERDFEKIQEYVKGALPHDQYRRIDWKNWQLGFATRNNGYFKHQVFFHPSALAGIQQASPRQMTLLFKNHLEDYGVPNVAPFYSTGAENMNKPWQERFHADMHFVGEYLSAAFNQKSPAEERHKAFMRLKSIPLWRDRAASFLLSKMPKDRFEDLISYDMTLSAKGQETISYKVGKFEQEALYKSLTYIQNVIGNRSFDLRLYTDENGSFTQSSK